MENISGFFLLNILATPNLIAWEAVLLKGFFVLHALYFETIYFDFESCNAYCTNNTLNVSASALNLFYLKKTVESSTRLQCSKRNPNPAPLYLQYICSLHPISKHSLASFVTLKSCCPGVQTPCWLWKIHVNEARTHRIPKKKPVKIPKKKPVNRIQQLSKRHVTSLALPLQQFSTVGMGRRLAVSPELGGEAQLACLFSSGSPAESRLS